MPIMHPLFDIKIDLIDPVDDSVAVAHMADFLDDFAGSLAVGASGVRLWRGLLRHELLVESGRDLLFVDGLAFSVAFGAHIDVF